MVCVTDIAYYKANMEGDYFYKKHHPPLAKIAIFPGHPLPKDLIC